MRKLLDILKLLIGWPLSVAALFFIGRLIFLRWQTVSNQLQEIHFLLLLSGVICFLAYFFIRSYVWHMLLKEKGYKLALYEVAYLWEISEVKRFVPGNIWSFLSRSFLFIEKGVDKKTIWLSMLWEIQLLLVASIFISLLSLPFLFSLFPNISKEIIQPVIVGGFAVSFIAYIFNTKIPILKDKGRFIGKLFPPFRPQTIIILSFISSLYLIAYGLGTYLVISSVVYLDPRFILSFIGFFVFSLLLGYLSLITPMGLGIREGIVIKGLSSIISVTNAALGAIFSRIVLIIAELLFLGGTYLWKKTRWRIPFKYTHFMVLLFLIFVYCSYFIPVTFLRHDNFYTGRFDLGNMDQTVWNTMQGNILQFTDPNGTETMSRIGFHADFILVLLSPFYFIWSHAKMLLVVQTVVLALGSIFVYLLAKEILKHKTLALLFSALYLLNPGVQYANLYDFHSVTLSTTFLLGTFYFLYKKNYIFFFIFFLLSAITKEQIWIIGIFFGIYIAILHKRKMIGLATGLLSIFCFYYLIWHAIPDARGSGHFALAYYSEFGETPGIIAKNIILSPVETIGSIFEPNKIHYLYQLLMPLGLFSLLSPLYLLFPSADFAVNLLSNNPQLHQIYYQYTAAITPFIFISALYGVKVFTRFFPKIPLFIVGSYLLFSTLYVAYYFGPLPGAKNPNLDMITKPKPFKNEIQKYLSQIPQDKKVSSINNIGAHLSQRKDIYVLPLGIEKADIIIFNLDDPYSQPSPSAQKEIMQQLQNNASYKLAFQKGSVYAFEK